MVALLRSASSVDADGEGGSCVFDRRLDWVLQLTAAAAAGRVTTTAVHAAVSCSSRGGRRPTSAV